MQINSVEYKVTEVQILGVCNECAIQSLNDTAEHSGVVKNSGVQLWQQTPGDGLIQVDFLQSVKRHKVLNKQLIWKTVPSLTNSVFVGLQDCQNKIDN